MQIRQAKIGDYRGIYRLVKTAFAAAKVSDGTEQDLVLALRAGTGYIPPLELVAEQENGLAGHVMLTRLGLTETNRDVRALLLAPLCVHPEEQARGVGGALVRTGFDRARQLGYEAAFLVGDPAYYSRFGFRPVEQLGLHNASCIPAPYVQGVALREGALDRLRAAVHLA